MLEMVENVIIVMSTQILLFMFFCVPGSPPVSCVIFRAFYTCCVHPLSLVLPVTVMSTLLARHHHCQIHLGFRWRSVVLKYLQHSHDFYKTDKCSFINNTFQPTSSFIIFYHIVTVVDRTTF